MVNTNIDTAVEPVFNFSNLRVLALADFKYDGCAPSACLTSLVWILKGSPRLEYLYLGRECRLGGLTLAGYFLEDMHGIPARMLETLCRQYQAAGGLPLRLKILRFRGEELSGPVGPNHYLRALTDWTYLEEIHIEADQETTWTGNPGFSESLEALEMVHPRHLPKLRKLTWPNNLGWVPKILVRKYKDGDLDLDYLGRLVLKFPE